MPEDFNSSVLGYASQQFGTQPETKVETEMGTTPTETVAEESNTNQGAEMATDTNQDVTQENNDTNNVSETIAPTTVEPDYNSWLEKETGGVLKDIDSFKAVIPKITEYDQLVAQKAELEQKLNVNPFKNEFVAKLNEMYGAGTSEDQIKNFIKISSIDLEKLSPLDAKIAVMVKEGYNEEIARAIVEEEYPIDSFEEGSKERIILEEKLRVSAIADKEVLRQYKADMSKVDDPHAEQARLLAEQQEQQRLQAIAEEEQYKSQVTQVVPRLAEIITGIGELTIKPGKEGEYEAVKMQFDFSDDFKAKVPEMLENYYMNTKTPITEESIADARQYINASYLANNIESIIQANTRHVEAVTWEKAVNKYENRSGLPPESTNVNVDNSQAEYSSFLNRVANGK